MRYEIIDLAGLANQAPAVEIYVEGNQLGGRVICVCDGERQVLVDASGRGEAGIIDAFGAVIRMAPNSVILQVILRGEAYWPEVFPDARDARGVSA